MTRRDWLQIAGAAGAAGFIGCGRKPESPPEFALEEATIVELQARLARGAWTAEDLAQTYLERIDAVDKQGPALNAIIELNPEALAIARRLDEERAEGNLRGPLHGIPIVIKDNIDTADKMQTTAGSLALAGSITQQDAGVVSTLRAAGVVLLGKTNLSEWANFRSFRSTSGWSARGGLTRNPYALDRNPCGSSSGSAVAAAANLCAGAVGTETNGSVICPSSINGIVGVKPTVGLIAGAGIVPISHTQDTAGPMARTVADAATLLGGMVAPTQVQAGRALADYRVVLDPAGLGGVRLGVVRPLFGRREDIDRNAEEALQAMEKAGAVLVDVNEFPSGQAYGDEAFELMLYEFHANVNEYLARLSPEISSHTLAEVIIFNEKNAEKEMPYFGQEILELAVEKGPLTDPRYRRALEKTQRVARTAIDDALRRYQVAALTAPSAGPAWVTDLVHGDRSSHGSSSAAARAGYPHVTVPAGMIQGLPVGLSFFASAYEEPKLLTLAYAFEQLRRAREPPRFRPSAESL